MKPIRLATLSVLLLAAFTARAESLVVNGSLNGSIANMDVPTGWTVLGGTPDTMDGGNNVGVAGATDFGVAPASASPDGGTWVGIGMNGSYVERFGQTLSGLSIGQTYTVSWFAGNFGLNRTSDTGNVQYLGSNAIDVLVDGVSIGHGATRPSQATPKKQTPLRLIETEGIAQFAPQGRHHGRVEKRNLPRVIRAVVEEPVTLEATPGHMLLQALLLRHSCTRHAQSYPVSKP